MATPTTASLFDDGLDKDFGLVEVLARTKPITKAQQHFQRLVARIELKREQLKQWQAYALRYNQRLAGEMEPLRNQLRTGQRQMAALIDELLSQPMPARRLGRVQRAKLRQVLMNRVTGRTARQVQRCFRRAVAAIRDGPHRGAAEGRLRPRGRCGSRRDQRRGAAAARTAQDAGTRR